MNKYACLSMFPLILSPDFGSEYEALDEQEEDEMKKERE